MFRPETGAPLYELAQVLLRGESTLSEGDRELIAAYVSHLNECVFCMNSHAAASRCLLGAQSFLVDSVLTDVSRSPVSPKLKAPIGLYSSGSVGVKLLSPST